MMLSLRAYLWKLSVAGTGYVGLSNAVILAQNNKIFAVDLHNQRLICMSKRYPS